MTTPNVNVPNVAENTQQQTPSIYKGGGNRQILLLINKTTPPQTNKA